MASGSASSRVGLPTGGGVAFSLRGASVEACLAEAAERFSDAFAVVHPSIPVATDDVELHGASPSALLLAVLAECLRRGREGRVVVGVEVDVSGDGLRASVGTVPASHPRVRSAIPHVVSWHEVSLASEPAGGWSGRVEVR